MTTAGGSNPKLVTMQQLIAAGEVNGSNSKGALNHHSGGVHSSHGSSSVPGGNRPGVNSSGAAIKKNGLMGVGGIGMGSYAAAKYNQHHHMSSQLH